MAITNTSRDEFAPAVSPDGRLVAHVSNELGNIDLFTMPIGGGPKQHVNITGLKFRNPSGRLHVRVLDEAGQPTPARLYVKASDGKAYCPQGSPSSITSSTRYDDSGVARAHSGAIYGAIYVDIASQPPLVRGKVELRGTE